MLVHPVRRDGKIVGYQYGDTGKVYPVSMGKGEAAKKAGEQGSDIEHSEEEKK